MAEKNFVDGMKVTRNEKAPDFVKASIGVNIGDFLVWANKNSKNGWVNFQIKESKGGKLYAELDTWEKKSENPATVSNEDSVNPQNRCSDCTATEQCANCSIPF